MLFHAPTVGHRAFGQASGAEAGARARGHRKAKHLAAQAEQPGVGMWEKWWFFMGFNQQTWWFLDGII